MEEDVPVTSAESVEPETEDIANRPKEVEVTVSKDIYEAAKSRAQSQGSALIPIARLALTQAAAQLPPGPPQPVGQRKLRPYRQRRERLRFKMPINTYLAAKARLDAAGRSVSEAVETGLAAYAETGEL